MCIRLFVTDRVDNLNLKLHTEVYPYTTVTDYFNASVGNIPMHSIIKDAD